MLRDLIQDTSPASTMTSVQLYQYNHLVSALWEGNIGEVEFTEVALELGATLERVIQAIGEIREEDGTL
jgi:hypothetical protein